MNRDDEEGDRERLRELVMMLRDGKERRKKARLGLAANEVQAEAEEERGREERKKGANWRVSRVDPCLESRRATPSPPQPQTPRPKQRWR